MTVGDKIIRMRSLWLLIRKYGTAVDNIDFAAHLHWESGRRRNKNAKADSQASRENTFSKLAMSMASTQNGNKTYLNAS